MMANTRADDLAARDGQARGERRPAANAGLDGRRRVGHALIPLVNIALAFAVSRV